MPKMQKQKRLPKEKKLPRGKPFEPGHKYSTIYKDRMVVVRFSLPTEEKEKLAAYCDRHDIKISALLRELVEDFLRSVPDQ